MPHPDHLTPAYLTPANLAPAHLAPARLAPAQFTRAVTRRDLTDPGDGEHAVQLVLEAVVSALQDAWGCTVRTVRSSPIVPVSENYDRLGYAAHDVTRARRYTRYISSVVMLRSHTSAMLPVALESYRGPPEPRGSTS